MTLHCGRGNYARTCTGAHTRASRSGTNSKHERAGPTPLRLFPNHPALISQPLSSVSSDLFFSVMCYRRLAKRPYSANAGTGGWIGAMELLVVRCFGDRNICW